MVQNINLNSTNLHKFTSVVPRQNSIFVQI